MTLELRKESGQRKKFGKKGPRMDSHRRVAGEMRRGEKGQRSNLQNAVIGVNKRQVCFKEVVFCALKTGDIQAGRDKIADICFHSMNLICDLDK